MIRGTDLSSFHMGDSKPNLQDAQFNDFAINIGIESETRGVDSLLYKGRTGIIESSSFACKERRDTGEVIKVRAYSVTSTKIGISIEDLACIKFSIN